MKDKFFCKIYIYRNILHKSSSFKISFDFSISNMLTAESNVISVSVKYNLSNCDLLLLVSA